MFMIVEGLYKIFGSLFSSKGNSIKTIIIIIVTLIGLWFVYSTGDKVLTFLGFDTKENLKKNITVLKTNNDILSNINDNLINEIKTNDKANDITIKSIIKDKDEETNNKKVLIDIETERKNKITEAIKEKEIISKKPIVNKPLVKEKINTIIINKEKFNTISKINITSIWETYLLTVKKDKEQ